MRTRTLFKVVNLGQKKSIPFCRRFCISTTTEQIIKDYLPQAYAHPFNQALYHGDLPRENFNDFLFNDKWYLKHFSDYFYKIADRQPDYDHRQRLYQLASDAFETEEDLFEKYSSDLKASDLLVKKVLLPGVKNYVTHLKRYADHAAPAVALMAFLPCFYLYAEMGLLMKQEGIATDNPYRLWIQSYSIPKFIAAKSALVDLIKELSPTLTYDQQQQGLFGFERSIAYEFGFWDTVMHPTNQSTIQLKT